MSRLFQGTTGYVAISRGELVKMIADSECPALIVRNLGTVSDEESDEVVLTIRMVPSNKFKASVIDHGVETISPGVKRLIDDGLI